VNKIEYIYNLTQEYIKKHTCTTMIEIIKESKHSYDILGAGMLWKSKTTRKFLKIRVKECFDKVLNEEF
jgi:hypothetical protein